MKNIAIKAPDWLRKNAVYQINPRTFSKEGTIGAITKELPFLKELGFNIIYLCPIFEEDDSDDINNWSTRQKASETGNPKNMYRMNDYFSIDCEYGNMEDLKEMIDAAHKLDMKVILDLVYAHIGPNAPIIQKHPEFVQQRPDGSFIYTEWNFPALDFRSEGLREYLWCNMVYYISVIDADGFRLDVGDYVPVDFWTEARRRIQKIKRDAVLINEGAMFEKLTYAFDSSYCFKWHDTVRKVYCKDEPATLLKEAYDHVVNKSPVGARILRDIDTHDTVTDWDGRTEVIAGHNGMEQIEVLNYIIDGIPMVYCGNELACTAYLNMFANRFHMGKFEVTDRDDKSSEASVRRQEIIKALNKMKACSELLDEGETVWVENSAPDSVVTLKRVLGDKEILFVGNTKNSEITVDAKDVLGKKCILCNGSHKIENGMLTLGAREYALHE